MPGFRVGLIALAVLLPALPAPVVAQGTPEQRTACRPDTQKFCRGLRPEPLIMLRCLQENREKLTRACRKVLEDNGQ